jgi:pimeloyl-ACP methyl ester carboxylesterase
MFQYRPGETLAAVTAPIVALAAAENEAATRMAALADVARALAAAGRPGVRVATFPAAGHNLMRYHPVEVTAAILAVASDVTS